MLHADFRRDANLLRAAAQQFGQTGRCHGTGHAYFALAAHFGARDRRVHFVQSTDRARCHKVTDVNIRADGFDKVVIVSQHGRYDAAGAVGWSGDHAATGGVLFVDRQREHIDPVNDVHRIAGQFVGRDQQAT
ncbi:hypothetical protein D3C72_1689610 [compost metagenome]